jgi:hypothetical protein
MKDHDLGIPVTEHPVNRGVWSKSREAIRVMKVKPTMPLGHLRSMPDSHNPGTPLAPAPRAAVNPFEPPNSPTHFREEP